MSNQSLFCINYLGRFKKKKKNYMPENQTISKSMNQVWIEIWYYYIHTSITKVVGRRSTTA